MAPSVDFTAWVEPNLDVTLGGVQYSCPPPSVAAAKIIVAFAVLSEHRLGLVTGDPDPELVELADSRADSRLAVITLGSTIYDRMVADGVTQTTIDRVGYYAMHFWARGKTQADWLAQAMWSPSAGEPVDDVPKARRRSKSGPSTASANRTRMASTPTIASQRT